MPLSVECFSICHTRVEITRMLVQNHASGRQGLASKEVESMATEDDMESTDNCFKAC